MKNYKSSDYAVNKYAKGIVYRGQRNTHEVTLEGFLAENPQLAESDFQRLKTISDAIFYKQDRDTHNQAHLDVSIHGMEESHLLSSPALEDEYIRRLEYRQALMAAQLLLESGKLTQVQRRRFLLYIVNCLSTRQIAEREGVSQRAIMKSLQAARSKLKNIFDLLGSHPPA